MEENVDKLESNIPSQELNISEEIKFFLKETARWGKFLGIVGFVFTGLIVIAAFFMIFFGSRALSQMGEAMGAIGGGFLGAIYLAMGL